MKQLFTTVFLLLFSFFLFAQDLQFSQLVNAPLSLNPALAGSANSNRLIGNYKHNKSVFSDLASEFAASFDTPIHLKNGDAIGLGLNARNHRDKAAGISISYRKKVSKGGNHIISGAIQPGIAQTNFLFAQEGISHFDLGAGLVYTGKFETIKKLELGISGFHLTQPDLTSASTGTNILYRRITLHSSAAFNFSTRWALEPVIATHIMGPSKEIYYGSQAHFQHSENLKISLGLFSSIANYYSREFSIRNLTGMVGVIYKNFAFYISTDADLRDLSSAADPNGLIELSTIFKFK